jgi:hypothetical protein
MNVLIIMYKIEPVLPARRRRRRRRKVRDSAII